MGFLEWVPSWLVHLMVFVGFLATIITIVANFIPFIAQYRVALQFLATIVLSIGLFVEGMILNQQSWIVKVNEEQAKVNFIEAEDKIANVEVQYKFVDRVKYVTVEGQRSKEQIPVIVTQRVDEECSLPPEIIEWHNQLATLKKGY